MLDGFPKEVSKTKIARGHWKLTRADGYSLSVIKGVNGWWIQGMGRKVKSLGIVEYDMIHGFTAHDQLQSRTAR